MEKKHTHCVFKNIKSQKLWVSVCGIAKLVLCAGNTVGDRRPAAAAQEKKQPDKSREN